jgi:predicted nucleic acid-binding protein
MKHYLLDTNILIYYFNGEMESTVENKVSALMSESFQISVISKMEFLGFSFSFAEKKQAMQLIEYATIIKLTDEIIQRVIDIRQEKRIKLPDAIIAATAIEYNTILVTRNTKDFKTLALETYNPFDDE